MSTNNIPLDQIEFVKPIPLKHMQGAGGHLPDSMEAAALWQFLLMAHQALHKVERQVTYEGDADQEVDLMQLAESSRKLFELSTLEGMFQTRLIAAAKAEAIRSRLGWDDRIDAWFASGGTSYRIQERNADKVGQ